MGFVHLSSEILPALSFGLSNCFLKTEVAFLYVHKFSVLLCLCSFRLALLFNVLAYKYFSFHQGALYFGL